MSSGSLTQEQIDQLMREQLAEVNRKPAFQADQMSADIIGEVGNISMSQAATTLSSILGYKVLITTPKVSYMTMEAIVNESDKPKVVTSIRFKKGLIGNNLLMLNVNDSVKIANLMMGGDGMTDSEELTELELSAVGEAMNQMIGSASTAMATMLKKVIDIFPPEVKLWDDKNEVDTGDIQLEDEVCRISFALEVEGILKSEIMQIYTLDAAQEITELMLSDQAEVLDRPAEKAAAPVKNVPVQPAAPAPQPEPQVTVQKPVFQELEDTHPSHNPKNLDLIMDVPLEFSVVLGESKKTIRDILSLGTGSVVELDKMTEEPLSIYVNGKRIAEGEVVVINENFGIRITNILSKEQRVRTL